MEETKKIIKQIIVKMEQDQIKELKQFCLDNDMTITDAVKQGLALLMKKKNQDKK